MPLNGSKSGVNPTALAVQRHHTGVRLGLGAFGAGDRDLEGDQGGGTGVDPEGRGNIAHHRSHERQGQGETESKKGSGDHAGGLPCGVSRIDLRAVADEAGPEGASRDPFCTRKPRSRPQSHHGARIVEWLASGSSPRHHDRRWVPARRSRARVPVPKSEERSQYVSYLHCRRGRCRDRQPCVCRRRQLHQRFQLDQYHRGAASRIDSFGTMQLVGDYVPGGNYWYLDERALDRPDADGRSRASRRASSSRSTTTRTEVEAPTGSPSSSEA